MSIPAQIRKTTTIFNAYIRKRDEGKPCISCGMPLPLQAGHFYSAGAYPTLRFDEVNVNGQCVQCNYFEDFKKSYKENLIARVGEEAVKELEEKAIRYKHETFKWDENELKKLQKTYLGRLKMTTHTTPDL